jgi:uncharacterized protein (UPF0332 family)
MPQDFDWMDYLKLAESLITDTNIPAGLEEAKLRSMVSRAYYAVYHKARTLLEKYFAVQISREHSQSDVIKEYKEGGDIRCIDVGDRLNTLFKTRKTADYENKMYINIRQAKVIIQNCRETIQLIRDIEQSLRH